MRDYATRHTMEPSQIVEADKFRNSVVYITSSQVKSVLEQSEARLNRVHGKSKRLSNNSTHKFRDKQIRYIINCKSGHSVK